jgi:hypothetical protein
MKTRTFAFFSLLALILIACEPPVAFDKPQPADVKALAGFPKNVQGNYLSIEDSSMVNVSSKMLIRSYFYTEKIHVSQLDSSQQLIGDSLFDPRTGKGSLALFEGDSIVTQINESDTLFLIDYLNVLKKFKGYYFVNIFIIPDRWQVKKLEFSHGSLFISDLNTKEDIEQLKTLTDNVQDSVPYLFSPTKKQFKKFVRQKGFRETEVLRKINR